MKIENWILNQCKRDINILFKIIIHTLTIVAFVGALDYFSKKASIIITPYTRTNGFYKNSIKKFYTENDLSIPLVFNEFKSLRFLSENEIVEEHDILIGGTTSNLDFIKALIKGRKIPESLKTRRIDKLKEQIKNYSFKKQSYVYISEEFYEEQMVFEMLTQIEPRLTQEDYIVFLCALIQSREIHQSIAIENNGDIDLKNLKIIFPAPISKVSESRNNNIYDFNIESLIPHDVVLNSEDLTINLLSLKKGEIFSFAVFTKENKIERNEISYSYDAKKLVDKEKALHLGIDVFIFITLLTIFFKGGINTKK